MHEARVWKPSGSSAALAVQRATAAWPEADSTSAISCGGDANIYSQRGGGTDFKFLAPDTVPPCLADRPMLVPRKPELREYKAVFVVADKEVTQFNEHVRYNQATALIWVYPFLCG